MSSDPSQFPEKPVLQKRSYASAMSYVGITRRIAAWARRVVSNANVAVTILIWVVAALFMLIMWAIVSAWYIVTILLFSWLLFPFRLIRRSQRKREHLAQAQLATTQAMMLQQQAQQAQVLQQQAQAQVQQAQELQQQAERHAQELQEQAAATQALAEAAEERGLPPSRPDEVPAEPVKRKDEPDEAALPQSSAEPLPAVEPEKASPTEQESKPQ